jgi:predicted glycoside hydrolase/deacetylase ChbG (UPF0249 family)
MQSMSNEISQSEVFSKDAGTQSQRSGRLASLIVNADDWGLDKPTTDCILDCVMRQAVSSASAMVFMEDSERAASVAGQYGVDTGLHLNLSSPFTAKNVSPELRKRQQRIIGYLRGSKIARTVYHPLLAASFEYVVRAQLDEYERLYGAAPRRVDGHHHLHLCANVQKQELLPRGIVVRRNFSFAPGEKSWINRLYRERQDRQLARRHRLTDFFFALCPMEPPGRLEGIFALAREAVVEVETHPVNSNEYLFLTSGRREHRQFEVPIAPNYTIA